MSYQPGDDVVAIEHEILDRLVNVVVTVVPLALLGAAGRSSTNGGSGCLQ
jgi:hypothetical protein